MIQVFDDPVDVMVTTIDCQARVQGSNLGSVMDFMFVTFLYDFYYYKPSSLVGIITCTSESYLFKLKLFSTLCFRNKFNIY